VLFRSSECSIYKASTDPALARKIAEAISRPGREVTPDRIRCGGCRGDRSQHWSADCGILACCTDDRGLDSCHKCEEFSCARIEKWAEGDERYAEALRRLRDLRGSV